MQEQCLPKCQIHSKVVLKPAEPKEKTFFQSAAEQREKVRKIKLVVSNQQFSTRCQIQSCILDSILGAVLVGAAAI